VSDRAIGSMPDLSLIIVEYLRFAPVDVLGRRNELSESHADQKASYHHTIYNNCLTKNLVLETFLAYWFSLMDH
jgi:hypothetical protein